MSALRQLQLRYEADEDRILLRVSTQNDEVFSLWLTRRYCALLLAVLDKHQALDPEIAERPTAEAKRAVQRFKEEAANAQANFGSDFQESSLKPLGDVPMLAYRLSYRAAEDKLQLTFAPRDGRAIAFTLDRQLSLNLYAMLAKTIRAADWRLLPADVPSAAPPVVN